MMTTLILTRLWKNLQLLWLNKLITLTCWATSRIPSSWSSINPLVTEGGSLVETDLESQLRESLKIYGGSLNVIPISKYQVMCKSADGSWVATSSMASKRRYSPSSKDGSCQVISFRARGKKATAKNSGPSTLPMEASLSSEVQTRT